LIDWSPQSSQCSIWPYNSLLWSNQPATSFSSLTSQSNRQVIYPARTFEFSTQTMIFICHIHSYHSFSSRSIKPVTANNPQSDIVGRRYAGSLYMSPLITIQYFVLLSGAISFISSNSGSSGLPMIVLWQTMVKCIQHTADNYF